MKRKIAVLGGDLRQVCLAQLLSEDGWEVMTWGLDKAVAPCSVSLSQALEAEIVVLPLPVCRGEWLNLPLTDTRLSCSALFERLHPEQIVFGGAAGSIPAELKCDGHPVILDYYEREEVQICNAVPTAEGAIMRAMEATKYTLHGSRCLVVGYGRIGKILSHRLHGLGADVSVSARKCSDLAWIEAYGYHAVHTGRISEQIADYDLIFNTVPAIVLDADCLKAAKQSCILFELASLPGGIDLGAVKAYNLQLFTERGLPGEVAPKTSANVILRTIYRILEEQGERV